MDIKDLIINLIVAIIDFENEKNVNIDKNVFIQIIRTVIEKDEEIDFYFRRGRISQNYILESLQIILNRSLIDRRRDINENMYKEALARKDCDHYPWCEEPLNR